MYSPHSTARLQAVADPRAETHGCVVRLVCPQALVKGESDEDGSARRDGGVNGVHGQAVLQDRHVALEDRLDSYLHGLPVIAELIQIGRAHV